MLKLEPTGDWRSIYGMFLYRRDRMASLKKRSMRSIAKAFRKTVKDNIPKDKKFDDYRKSIKLREVRGDQAIGDYAFAVVSIPWTTRVDKLNDKETLVYAVPTGAPISPLGMLLVEIGPWVPSRLPDAMHLVSGVKLVHKAVSKQEADRVRTENDKQLKARKDEIVKLGAKPRDGRAPKEPESTPDIAHLAGRMEFGIFEPKKPHWSIAWRRRDKMIQESLREHDPAKDLMDPNFNGWTQKVRAMKTISAARFVKQYRAFSKRLEKV